MNSYKDKRWDYFPIFFFLITITKLNVQTYIDLSESSV